MDLFKNYDTITFLPSLVEQFKECQDTLFFPIFVKMMGFFPEKATELYTKKEVKNSRHIFYHIFQLINIYGIDKNIKLIDSSSQFVSDYNSYYNNIDEFICLLKSEKIEALIPGFSRDKLIEKGKLTKEELINILDTIYNAYSHLKYSKVSSNNASSRGDVALKSIYLANIVKIRFKFFNEVDYKNLYEMAEKSWEYGENAKTIRDEFEKEKEKPWAIEIREIKRELSELIKKAEDEDNNNSQKERDEINKKYNELENVKFLVYILNNYPYTGLNEKVKEDAIKKECETKKKMKTYLSKLKGLYQEDNYKEDTAELKKQKEIMREIHTLLNQIFDKVKKEMMKKND